MRRLVRPRPERPEVPSAAGERILAWTRTDDGRLVAGTRDALHLPARHGPDDEQGPGHRVPWERVETAEWDDATGTLHVVEVGTWDEPRPEHRLALSEAVLLLDLVRERVTASVVLQRHVAVHGRRGVFVIARRAPSGARDLSWVYRFDADIDPADPDVRRRATEALASARAELGLD